MTQPMSVSLGALVAPVKTWSPERDAPDKSFEYIDLSAVNQDKKVIVAAREVPCAEAPSRAKQIVAAGDVLVSTVGPNLNGVARVPIQMDGATASTGFCVLRPHPERLDSVYLFHWVRSSRFIAEMVRRATGASYPAVSDRIVLESHLPLPPVTEQRRIAEILDKADALRAKRRATLAQLETLTHSIFLDMFGDPATNPKGWRDSMLLGDAADIVSGVTIGRNLDGKSTRTVPYLAVANVQDRHLDLSVAKTTEATDEEIRRYRLERNDLLLTEGGDPDKLGRGTLWNDELPECIHQNHVFRVRPRSEEFTPLFLNWLVGSQRGKRYFLRSAKQTTGIASINMTQLRAFPLLTPPLHLQQFFGERLSACNVLKATHLASLAELDTLFAAIQNRAFRGEL